jgi:hypothetical protein
MMKTLLLSLVALSVLDAAPALAADLRTAPTVSAGIAGMPAFAAEQAPLPVSSPSASTACAPTASGTALDPQSGELPSWLASERPSGLTTNSVPRGCSVVWCNAHCDGLCIIFGGFCQCA